MQDLYQSAVAAFPKTGLRQHATHPIIIKEITWLPFVGLKTLFIKGLAQNERREYNPIILFKKVDYEGKEIKITASNGKEYSFDKLSLESTDVNLKCNCGDYFWRFNFYNFLDKSHYGTKRAKYESKGIGPPANPQELPGVCKHLMKLSSALQEAGIFKN